MKENKTKPNNLKVEDFLSTVNPKRKDEALQLIKIMKDISKTEPIMWGSSIIGFGIDTQLESAGREVEVPKLSFSPRKDKISLYFCEGFDNYDLELAKLGKFKISVGCLYINKLSDVDLEVLKVLLTMSYNYVKNSKLINDVDNYIKSIPASGLDQFNKLRSIIRSVIPEAEEIVSYGIIGYRVDQKRPKIFIGGWRNHVSIYPVPKDPDLVNKLTPYIKGKGTLWFSLDEPLPERIIVEVVKSLIF